ncbi:glucose-1-phosphate cytidylyltransferase [Candidatus Woesearchaeota archaeon]|nr:glucose-1-phosphate cytidylyltransferase [Candidatus Woesearchaeota archaeon]
MKVVILAGGKGTRLSEETQKIPKPMVEIGGKPILWHIMKSYSAHGYNDFIICLGYKGHIIKKWFENNKSAQHNEQGEDWKIALIATGEETMTGGRVRRVRNLLGDKPFMLTYGDGVSDVDINVLVAFHKEHGKLVTVTAVEPTGRFGVLVPDKDNPKKVVGFKEKTDYKGTYINGGFFVVNPKALDYVTDDRTTWEREPLEQLAKDGELMAFHHHGFWRAMDSLRDKIELEEIWAESQPWKVWKD